MIFVGVTMPAERRDLERLAQLGLRKGYYGQVGARTGLFAPDVLKADQTLQAVTWVRLDTQVKRVPRPKKRRIVRDTV